MLEEGWVLELKGFEKGCYNQYGDCDFCSVFFVRPKEKHYEAPEYHISDATAVMIEPRLARPGISLAPKADRRDYIQR